MALKLEEIKFSAGSRRITSITDDTIDYRNNRGEVTLTIPVKVITLETGVKGLATLENYPTLYKALKADEEGYAILPENWKVGAAKNGLPTGFWYDSEGLGGSPMASLRG